MSAKTVAMRVALLLVLLSAVSAQTAGDSTSDSKTITIDKKIAHHQATIQPYSTYASRSQQSAQHYPRPTASIKLSDDQVTNNPYLPKAEASTGVSDAKSIEARHAKNYKVRSPNGNSDGLENYLNKAANPQEPLDKQTVQDITNSAVGCTLDSIARNMSNKPGSVQQKAENVTVTTSEKEITTDLINEYLKIVSPSSEQAQAKQMQTSETLRTAMAEFQKSLADCVLMQKARASMEKSNQIENQSQSLQTVQKTVSTQTEQQQQQTISGAVQNSQQSAAAGLWQNSANVANNIVGQPLQSAAQYIQKSLDVNINNLPPVPYRQNLQVSQGQQQQQQQQQQQSQYYQTISQSANNAKIGYDAYNSDTFGYSYPHLLEYAQSLMQNSGPVSNPSGASSVSWSYSSQPSASYIQTYPISYTISGGEQQQLPSLQYLSSYVESQSPAKRAALDDIWKSANNFAGSIVDTSTKSGPVTSGQVLGSIGNIWSSASNLAQSIGGATPRGGQYPIKARAVPVSPQLGMTHTILPASMLQPGANLAQEITRIATDQRPITADRVFDATSSLFQAGQNLYNSYGNQNGGGGQAAPVQQSVASLFQPGQDLAKKITEVATDQRPITADRVLDATSSLFKAGENLYNANGNNNNAGAAAASSASDVVGAQLRALSSAWRNAGSSAQGSLNDALQQATGAANNAAAANPAITRGAFGIGPYYAGGYFPRNSQSSSAAGSVYNSAAQLASDIIDASQANSGQTGSGPNVIPLGVVSKSTLEMVGNILNAANSVDGVHPRFYQKKK
ncbi:hypothetical protein TKK_0009332 [Trichogramma kaykai]|uniref:Uncharacterized protein n=1 Tax=Trichogramma kaykai TaxID=54128 RepID=A0ABD2X2I7_9HYME